jgi:hypothetical protein
LCLALFGWLRTVDPTLPVNGGLMRPIRTTAPEGSVVNAQFPAPCGVRFALAQTLYGTLQSILAQALPGQVPALGAGQATILAVSLLDPVRGKRAVTVVEPMIGGSGGRAQADGVDGCDFSQGALANTPVEAIENEVPVLIRDYAVIPDSAGPGRHRGGLAFRLDFQVFHPDTILTARGMERFRFQPFGIEGGSAGTSGDCWLNPGAPGEKRLGKIDVVSLQAGDVVSVRTPGGGGGGASLRALARGGAGGREERGGERVGGAGAVRGGGGRGCGGRGRDRSAARVACRARAERIRPRAGEGGARGGVHARGVRCAGRGAVCTAGGGAVRGEEAAVCAGEGAGVGWRGCRGGVGDGG